MATLTYLLRLYLPWQECYTSSVFDVPAVTAKAFKPVPEVGPIARRCVLGEATLHIRGDIVVAGPRFCDVVDRFLSRCGCPRCRRGADDFESRTLTRLLRLRTEAAR